MPDTAENTHIHKYTDTHRLPFCKVLTLNQKQISFIHISFCSYTLTSVVTLDSPFPPVLSFPESD